MSMLLIALWTSVWMAFATHALDDAASSSCSALRDKVQQLIPGRTAEIYATELFPDGTTFSTPTAIPEYSSPVPNLPSFCRFGAFFNTSSTSKVQFEIWLPVKNWNGRFAFVGNGGDNGGVNYPDMGIPLSKYGFAVASTNTGHNGSSTDGTFAINNPETQIDYGFRAVHLSTVFSKNVIREFYGTKPEKSYWLGCSSGGKQGLKEIQFYPDEFDGVIAGSPAYAVSHLRGWVIQSNLLNNPSVSGFVDGTTWLQIHAATIKQCDALDGLVDGIITDPSVCRPNFHAMNFINADQADVAASIYTNWTWPHSGRTIFPAYAPGSEFAGDGFIVGNPFGPGPDYYKYQVLNLTNISSHTFTKSELLALLKQADRTNPGQSIVDDVDISPFIQRGGKLITFVGMADQMIPTGSTIRHHEKVKSILGRDPRESFRMFTIPGMGHCGGGYRAPSSFGGPSQRDAAQNGTGQPPDGEFDSRHDMVLALMDWTEKGEAPDMIIGTKYKGDNRAEGVEFQRPLCPYPLMAHYTGSDPSRAVNFVCS